MYYIFYSDLYSCPVNIVMYTGWVQASCTVLQRQKMEECEW
uniref:Uncharacterized protein n=1 Tax=Anguilla anguilla TaxID=7936 RepID=A0A0E9TQF3_ANGAN